MLWLKAFHIIFVVTWFAGLFYLPRLFAYEAEAAGDESLHQRMRVWQKRLLILTHVAGGLALGFGVLLLWWWASQAPDYFRQGWLHAKLTLVAALIAYHVSLAHFVSVFARRSNTRSGRWFRVFNELPALALIGIVILVVVKPF